MSTPEEDKIRCGNFACKCLIDPDQTVCSDYCAAVDGWSSEVQTEVCACGHGDCGSNASPAA